MGALRMQARVRNRLRRIRRLFAYIGYLCLERRILRLQRGYRLFVRLIHRSQRRDLAFEVPHGKQVPEYVEHRGGSAGVDRTYH